MKRAIPIVLVGAAVLTWHGPRGDASPEGGDPPRSAFPVGGWKVEFSNGVIEACDIGNGGESTVEEPGRRCVGKAERQGSTVVIAFGDDRIERWTPVGERFVVEHWYPGSRLPTVTPVLGIAQRSR